MSDDTFSIIVALFVFAVLLIGVGLIGEAQGRKRVEDQAVDRGFGRYVVTAEREVKFEWIECERAKEAQGK